MSTTNLSNITLYQDRNKILSCKIARKFRYATDVTVEGHPRTGYEGPESE
jgi:hypothetical protein